MVNQTFHVLHPNLAPCPDGVTGELFIGGIGVARGYWKDPERSAARFIIHPDTGERLYRTGDLGRYRADGNIEFLGRADFQVKIRGFRIELGEIEAALAAHDRVRRAVVVAHGEGDRDRRLIAHVVREGANTIAADDLREFLGGRLPDYMVPAEFLFHEQLPLTANGKVDLKALPAPGAAAAPANRAPFAAPTNEIEEILLQVWKPVLGIQHLGIDDDFFATGGTSLSGTRLIMRLRSAFDLFIPIQCLVEHPTIRHLSAAIEKLLLTDVAARSPDLTAAPAAGPTTP